MHYTFLAFLSSADILLYRCHFTDFNWFILDSDFYTLKITVPQSQWYLPNCISTFFCSWSSPWCTILCWIWASFILSAGCWTTKARCMIGPGVHAKVLLIVITGYKCDPHLLRGHRWRFECIPYTALLEKYKHKNNKSTTKASNSPLGAGNQCGKTGWRSQQWEVPHGLAKK